MIVLDNWNGTPDDADVTVTILGSNWRHSEPPQWNGQDEWSPNAEVRAYTHYRGYVSQGVLVADTRNVGEDFVSIALNDPSGKPVDLDLATRLNVRVGRVTRDEMVLIQYGRWNLRDALAQVPFAVDVLAGSSDGGSQGILLGAIEVLLDQAADLPLGEAATPGVPCGAISLASRAVAYRALLEGSTDAGCQ
jgi:hypothetical protein